MIQTIGHTEQIRYIETIMRNANAQYPRISPYRVAMHNAQRYVTPEQREWIREIGRFLDNFREKCNSSSLAKIFENDIYGLKINRIGDCGESTALSMGALLANGNTEGRIARLIFDGQAKDIKTGQILQKTAFDTTHECVLLNVSDKADLKNPKTYGKNVIVMDAWEGFCTNLSEAFKKYFDIFLMGTYKHIDYAHNAELSYKPRFVTYNHTEKFDDTTVKKFQELFPELIIKKN